MSRRNILLIILIISVLTAGYLWLDSYWKSTAGKKVTEKKQKEKSKSVKIVDLRTGLRETVESDYRKKGRNLFNFGKSLPTVEELEAQRKARAAARRRKKKKQQQKKQKQKEKEERRKQRQQQKMKEETKAPPVFVEFIGYIGPGDGKIAIFKDKKEPWMYMGTKGEKVKNYIIREVGYESVLLGFENSDAQKRIPLKKGG